MERVSSDIIIQELDEFIDLNEPSEEQQDSLAAGARRRAHSVMSVVIWTVVMLVLVMTTSTLFGKLREIGKEDISAMGRVIAYFAFAVIFSIMTSICMVTILITSRPFINYRPRERQE